jgi:hypothetical protein
MRTSILQYSLHRHEQRPLEVKFLAFAILLIRFYPRPSIRNKRFSLKRKLAEHK